MERVFLTRERLDVVALTAELRRDDAGAVLTFVGTVRAEAQSGQQLVALDYEAYEEMALSQMQAIRQRAIDKLGVLDAVIAHRLGRMKPCEASIVVAVLSAHRAEAFEACRWIVDQIKADVPIWKKDVWSDGSTGWVDPAKS